ncbi:MAG: hypothetical protein KDA60_11245, partial [Planctomycetales bacterium]|nr:hypothetical protein [Planctomycetales bacterium]
MALNVAPRRNLASHSHAWPPYIRSLRAESLEPRHLLACTPQPVPYYQDFEIPGGAIETLEESGWCFNIESGLVSLSNLGEQHSGLLQMQFRHLGAGDREAVLALDLASQIGRDDLELEFFLNAPDRNAFNVAVSGDGELWGPNVAMPYTHGHVQFDLDQLLRDANVTADEDVYVRFHHTYSQEYVYVDDVKVSNERTRISIPYHQGFEGGSLALDGWGFVTPTENIRVRPSLAHEGVYGLRFSTSSDRNLVQEAVVTLAVPESTGRDSLWLDFAMRCNYALENCLRVELSADGNDWVPAVSTNAMSSSSYLLYPFDISQTLGAHDVTVGDNLFVKFIYAPGRSFSSVTIDDIQVYDAEVSGPQVIAVEPLTVPSGVAGSRILFDRPVSGMTAEAIRVISPVGEPLPLAGEPVNHRDELEYDILYAQPYALWGSYQTTISKAVHALDGTLLNQGPAHAVGADFTGDVIAFPAPIAIPVVTDFEQPQLDAATGWSFAAYDGNIAVVADNGPASGEYHLALTSGSSRTLRSATLHLDLFDYSAEDALELKFQAKSSVEASVAMSISTDGTEWFSVETLELDAVYVDYRFDLRAAMLAGDVPTNGELLVRFEHLSNVRDETLFLDLVQVGDLGAFGPRVEHVAPILPFGGAMEGLELVFDTPVVGLTGERLTLRSPDGVQLQFVGEPVDQGDGRTFQLSLAEPQWLWGEYLVGVGAEVSDLDGDGLNQDRLPTNGHAAEVPFAFTSSPVQFPYWNGFEQPDIRSLQGWQLDANDGTIAFSDSEAGGFGAQRLTFDSPTGGKNQTAVVQVALPPGAHSEGNTVGLSYWARSGELSTGLVRARISVDAENWMNLGQEAPDFGYQRYQFDLAPHLPTDTSVFYIQLVVVHSAAGAIHLDEFQISDSDVFGPYVVAVNPRDAVVGPVYSMIVEFNEPVIIPEDGISVARSGQLGSPWEAFDLAEGRRYRIDFVEPLELDGQYTVRVRDTVTDLAGNRLNQDRDALNGGVWLSTFLIEPEDDAAVSIPYFEDFEAGDFSAMPGWLAVENPGGVDVSEVAAYRGNSGLLLDRASVQLALNMSQQVGRTDLALDFRGTIIGTAYLELSGDGIEWFTVFRYSNNQNSGFRHIHHDLDQALSDAGIWPDGEVYIRFRYSSFAIVEIDDLRIDNADVMGPNVTEVVAATSGSTVFETVQVFFDEPIAALTSSDIVVRNPFGEVIPLAGEPVDDGSQQAFTLHVSPVLQLAGAYHIHVRETVIDLAGNQLGGGHPIFNGLPVSRVLDFAYEHALPFPHLEGFEGPLGNSNLLQGWGGHSDMGDVSLAGAERARSGDYALQIHYDGSPSTAAFAVDLPDDQNASDLNLDFWVASQNDAGYRVRVLASIDAESWTQVAWVAPDDEYRQMQLDLDEIISTLPLMTDRRLYIQFEVNRGTVFIDDLRLSTDDVIGPRV